MSDRNVAVVGFAHAPHVRRTDGTTNGVEMLMPCFAQLYEELGINISTPLVVPSVRRTCGAWAKPTTATLRSLICRYALYRWCL